MTVVDTNVLFGFEPLNTRVGDYRVKREGFIVTVFSKGRPFGRITLSPSGENRGALWLRDSLAGEFSYLRSNWYVYPIDQGRVSRQPKRIDPLTYIIKRFEFGKRPSSKSKSKPNGQSKARPDVAA